MFLDNSKITNISKESNLAIKRLISLTSAANRILEQFLKKNS